MHPLLQTTRRTPVRIAEAYPQNATYDFHRGLWVGPEGPLCNTPASMPYTKKEDLETGEDQKGQ